jgi:hypothetical protein
MVDEASTVNLDLNGDGVVNSTDFAILLNAYLFDDSLADIDGNGGVDIRDIETFFMYFFQDVATDLSWDDEAAEESVE